MGKGKKLVMGVSGILIGGMLLSGGMAFAETSNNSTVAKLAGKVPWVGQMIGHRGGMMGDRAGLMGVKGQFGAPGASLSQENLDQLVKEGTITQATADQIKAYIEKTNQEMKDLAEKMKSMTPEERKAAKSDTLGGRQKGQDLLTQLVKNNILSQEQADAIQAKLQEMAQTEKQQKISDILKTLVDSGTINQEQSDKILKSFADSAADREAQAQKLENMTVKEARQYIMDNRGQPQNYLGQLVTDGVITQAQADAFKNAMAADVQKQNQQRAADGLKSLVDKGTITQDQADKILAKLESFKTEQGALSEKIRNMTAEERQQHLKDNQVKPENPISQLVADGTITQDQANALTGIIGKAGIGGKSGMGGKAGMGGKSGMGGRHGLMGLGGVSL